MALFDFLKRTPTEAEISASEYGKEDARFSAMSYNPIFNYSFDGEKTPGEIGLIRRYNIDFNSLRARSWQSYLESEITQTVINKFITWIIGNNYLVLGKCLGQIQACLAVYCCFSCQNRHTPDGCLDRSLLFHIILPGPVYLIGGPWQRAGADGPSAVFRPPTHPD